MKVMVLVKATRSSEAGEMPGEQLLADMGKYNEQLVAAGIMKAGEGLKPSSQGARVRFSGTSRAVTDGPFAESKELVAGFWLWEVASLQEAIDWVKRCPNPMREDSDIEIRPLYSMEDFAEIDSSGELIAAERELAATLEGMSGEEAEIRRLLNGWSRALEAKDLDGLVKDYAPNAVLYDAIPPYKSIGAENIRQLWANCLPYFPAEFKSEHRDISIHVSGEMAILHGLHRINPVSEEDSNCNKWMRVTVGYQKSEGQWKVVHEHFSLPFNPLDNQVWFINDPNQLDMPDYGAKTCGDNESSVLAS